jgi:hypothetical protein
MLRSRFPILIDAVMPPFIFLNYIMCLYPRVALATVLNFDQMVTPADLHSAANGTWYRAVALGDGAGQPIQLPQQVRQRLHVLGWMSCSSRMPLWFASMCCKARQ